MSPNRWQQALDPIAGAYSAPRHIPGWRGRTVGKGRGKEKRKGEEIDIQWA